MSSTSGSTFRLQSSDSAFNQRVEAVFNSLEVAAQEAELGLGQRSTDIPEEEQEEQENVFCQTDRIHDKLKSDSSRPSSEFKGDDSSRASSEFTSDGFRKPQGVPRRWRSRGGGRGRGTFGTGTRAPDYVKNPQKWTRYSMTDTKIVSDRENKEVGVKLFNELLKRRGTHGLDNDDDEDEDDDEEGNTKTIGEGCTKILFKKPTSKLHEVDTRNEEVKGDKSSFGEVLRVPKKIKMSEYFVGKSHRKSKAKKNLSTTEATENDDKHDRNIRLDHLMYEDEDQF